ncbi:MAG: hypothetical protein OXI26_05180, partial [bacterium]|nr:hypothetical protein [bacterium]
MPLSERGGGGIGLPAALSGGADSPDGGWGRGGCGGGGGGGGVAAGGGMVGAADSGASSGGRTIRGGALPLE